MPAPVLNIIMATIQARTMSKAPNTRQDFLMTKIPLTQDVAEQIIIKTATIVKPLQPNPDGISSKCTDHRPAANQIPESVATDQITKKIETAPNTVVSTCIPIGSRPKGSKHQNNSPEIAIGAKSHETITAAGCVHVQLRFITNIIANIPANPREINPAKITHAERPTAPR